MPLAPEVMKRRSLHIDTAVRHDDSSPLSPSPLSPGCSPMFTPKAVRYRWSKPAFTSTLPTPAEEQPMVKNQDWRTFRIVLGLWLGYAFYNTMRRTYPQQMPTIARDLDIPLDRIGMPNSAFAATYGFAKLIGSVASDHLPCPECHALGLIFCGLTVAGLGLCSDLQSLSLLWGLQGLLQAFGWPLLARIIVSELPSKDRGKYWGVLSMAGNVGQMITPYCMVLVEQSGMSWRSAFFCAGGFAGAMSCVVWLLLCFGHPCSSTSSARRSNSKTHSQDSTPSRSVFRSLLLVLSHPALVALAICNLLSYFVHRSTAEWGVVYLVDTHIAGSKMQAAKLMFWLETGGSLGAFFSGYLSSYLGGRPGLTTVSSATLCTAAMSVLTWCSYRSLQVASVDGGAGSPLPFAAACALQFLAGVGLNGVRCMVGFHAATIAATSGTVGMANGVMEVVGQMGSVMAGQPLGALASRASDSTSGWIHALVAITMTSATVAVLNIFLLPGESRRVAGKAKEE